MDAARDHDRDTADHRGDLCARVPSIASPDAGSIPHLATRDVHGRNCRSLHRDRLAARGARRSAASNPHDAASVAHDRGAAATARRRAGDRACPRTSSARSQGSRRSDSPIKHRAPTLHVADGAAGMLDRVRRCNLGMASAGNLSARAPLRRMARRRARMLLHDRADVLVPGRPAMAERRAMAAMGDASLSPAGRRTEHRPRRTLHVFRSADLSFLCERAAHRGLHSPWRPGCRRRYHVGARFDFLSRARNAHHVSNARAAKTFFPLS